VNQPLPDFQNGFVYFGAEEIGSRSSFGLVRRPAAWLREGSMLGPQVARLELPNDGWSSAAMRTPAVTADLRAQVRSGGRALRLMHARSKSWIPAGPILGSGLNTSGTRRGRIGIACLRNEAKKLFIISRSCRCSRQIGCSQGSP
jgi:hypothetical protein